MFFDDYYLLDYIESTGTQYIDTGVVPQFTNFEINISNFCVTSFNTAWEDYFGCGTTDSSSDGFQFRRYQDYSTILSSMGVYTTGPYGSYQYSYSAGTLLKNVKLSDGVLYVNGSITSATGISTTKGTPTLPLYIFCRLLGSSSDRYSKIRFSKFEIIKNNIHVRDFVPAQRKSDNVIGLYDLVNDVFYTNQGTGTFNAGHIVDVSVNPVGSGSASLEMDSDKAVITSIPNIGWKFLNWQLNDYTQLEYIESTGTQYIDTLVSGSIIGKVETKFAYTLITTGAYRNYFGVEESGSPYNSFGFRVESNSSIFNCYARNISQNFTADISTHSMSIIIDTSGYTLNFDGDSYIKSGTEAISNLALTLFASRRGSSTVDRFGCVKLFNFKIYNTSNTLIRDFIPVFRHSDGAIGLLDLVNLKFYGNSGTDLFIGGDPVWLI